MMSALNLVQYLPLVTTAVAVVFSIQLFLHWRNRGDAPHLLWWMLGVISYGVGTLTESITTLIGWSEPVMKAWYVTGALLGAFPMAQGTVFLLLRGSVAKRLAVIVCVYVALAAVAVACSPVQVPAEPIRLSGSVLQWRWVRVLSIFPNTYSLVFLVGGAVWSALQYIRRGDAPWRARGNVLIAIGALLPGIGGLSTRLGYVEVLFVTELIGIVLIWLGYRQCRRGEPSKAVQLRDMACSAQA